MPILAPISGLPRQVDRSFGAVLAENAKLAPLNGRSDRCAVWGVDARNVLTRPERIKHLTDEGLWDEKKSVYGLPKVKIEKIKKKVKVKKKVEEAEGAGDKGTA